MVGISDVWAVCFVVFDFGFPTAPKISKQHAQRPKKTQTPVYHHVSQFASCTRVPLAETFSLFRALW